MCNLVFINHLLFFHLFDSNNLVCLSMTAHSYFSECTSANDLPGNKVPNWYLSPCKPIILRLFMKNFLFYQLFFLVWKFHLVHLMGQLVPSLLSFALFVLGLCILIFYVCLGTRSFLTRWRTSCGCLRDILSIRWVRIRSLIGLLLLWWGTAFTKLDIKTAICIF